MRLAAGSYLGQTTMEVATDALKVAHTVYAPLQEQPWHVHERPTFFIHLTGDHIDGAPDLDAEQAPLTVTYHPPSEYHRSRIGPKRAAGINLEPTDAWFESHQLDPKEFGKQRVLDRPALRTTALQIMCGLLLNNGDDQQDLDALAFELLEQFVDPAEPYFRGSKRWMGAAEERIRAEFASPISLSALALEAGVHPVYFARVFRQLNGCSVTEYVQRLRIQHAANLILSGDSIGSAALEAGFADQFHFARLLKRYYSVVPTQLKRYRLCTDMV